MDRIPLDLGWEGPKGTSVIMFLVKVKIKKLVWSREGAGGLRRGIQRDLEGSRGIQGHLE